jgi:hypothetical protein
MHEQSSVADHLPSTRWSPDQDGQDRAGRTPTTAGLTSSLARAQESSGAPLPDDARLKFESCLDTDLTGVRVHTGGESAAAAKAVGARAYAVGQDIHFGAGQYAPGSDAGQHLLAHEVAHTVQQAGAAPQRQAKLEVSAPGDASEHEADRAADAMVSGLSFCVGHAPSATAVSRSAEPAAESAAPSGDEAPADGEPDTGESSTEPVTLDELLGEGYEVGRDADLAAYWDARCEIDQLLPAIAAKDAAVAGMIEAEIVASEARIDEITACEEAAVEAARRDPSGAVIPDGITVGDLEWVSAELIDYGSLFLAESELWELILAVPLVEGLEALLSGWVALLKDFDARMAIAMKSFWSLEKVMKKYQAEFEEACKKAAIDGLTVFADVLILASLAGPQAFVAGIVLGLTSFAAGYAIEYGQKEPTQMLSVFNGTMTGGDMARSAAEWKFQKSTGGWVGGQLWDRGVVTTTHMSEVLGNLGLVLDIGSTVNDSAEAIAHKAMINDIQAALDEWKQQYGAMFAVWPSVCTCLHAAMPVLDGIKAALAKSMPLIESRQAEVDGLRARLGAE